MLILCGCLNVFSQSPSRKDQVNMVREQVSFVEVHSYEESSYTNDKI